MRINFLIMAPKQILPVELTEMITRSFRERNPGETRTFELLSADIRKFITTDIKRHLPDFFQSLGDLPLSKDNVSKAMDDGSRWYRNAGISVSKDSFFFRQLLDVYCLYATDFDWRNRGSNWVESHMNWPDFLNSIGKTEEEGFTKKTSLSYEEVSQMDRVERLINGLAESLITPIAKKDQEIEALSAQCAALKKELNQKQRFVESNDVCQHPMTSIEIGNLHTLAFQAILERRFDQAYNLLSQLISQPSSKVWETYSLMGLLNEAKGDFAQAFFYYDLLKDVKKDDYEHCQRMFDFCSRLNFPKKALEYCLMARASYRQFETKDMVYNSLSFGLDLQVAIAYSAAGDYENSIAYLNSMESKARHPYNESRLVAVLETSISVLIANERYDMAHHYLEGLATIWGEDIGWYSVSQFELAGVLYCKEAKFDQAIEVFTKANDHLLEADEEFNSNSVDILNRIRANYVGLAYAWQNKSVLGKAIHCMKKAVPYEKKILRYMEIPFPQITTLEFSSIYNSIARCYYSIGCLYELKNDYLQAQKYYRVALSYSRKNIIQIYTIELLMALGKLCSKIGDNAKAIFYLTRAKDICKFENDQTLKIQVMSELGLVYLKDNRLKKATDVFNQIYVHDSSLLPIDLAYLSKLNLQIAETYKIKGDADKVKFHLSAAETVLTNFNKSIST